MAESPKNVVARDLMIENFREIGADEPLRAAMDSLVELQTEPEIPTALIVVDSHGGFAGVLTARLLFRGLLTLWMPSKAVLENELLLEKELLEVVRDRSRVRVRDAVIQGLPTATPDDRLLSLVALSCEKKLEFIPVLANGKAIGLVPITRLFQRAASLALTPEDEGIRRDGKSFK